MQVPLVDLKANYLWLKDEIDEAITHVLERGQYVLGEEVEAFEEEWAEYCGAKYCVALSSANDALYLAFKTRMLSSETTVTMPAMGFIATAEAAFRAECNIALIDDITTVTSRDTIIVPVNLYGKRVQLDISFDISHVQVIEDAAQSHGLKMYGDIACHSFFPTKNLGAYGQAGALVTNTKSDYIYVRSMRVHGEGSKRFIYEHLSGNYRMDELQAAILRVKLRHLDAMNVARREAARMYRELLSVLAHTLQLPEIVDDHVFHIYALYTQYRDELAGFLKERGVQTAIHYPVPLHLQPALSHLGYQKGDFPISERQAETELSLPIYPEITDTQVVYVADQIKDFFRWRQS